jgi:hypothetical protein
MSSQKTTVVLDDDVRVAATATNTSSTATLTTTYGSTLHLKVTNGATGPTLPGQCQINVSADNGSHWYAFGGALISSLGNNVVTDWSVSIPAAIQYLRVVTSGNTVQAVVVRTEISTITKV